MEITNDTGSNQEAQISSSESGSESGGGVSAANGGEVLGAKATGDTANLATAPGTGEAAQGKPADVYSPNFKFKVKDKELEFDDFVKPIIKTKDVEQKLKDLYEKAHGLDEVKTARETFKTQAEEWKGKFTEIETGLQALGTFVKKGDFRSFFETLNIPKEKVIQYAIEELKYQELPPEQRAAIEQQREQERAYAEASTQNQSLQTQMAQLVQQQTTFELNQELAAPNVAQAIEAYDARLAKPGAFKAEVIRRGQYYEAVHKISPPASQLVQEILSLIGVQAQSPQGQQAISQEQSGQTVQQNQQNKPTISSFAGSGAKSPTRKVPGSIDDLRKMRQNLTT